MPGDSRPKVVVVGNCCAGKTTLVDGLQRRGYNALSCPQEHSVSPNLWRRHQPDLLIYLSASLPTIRQRRQISWGEGRLQRQLNILSCAKEHADLIVETDSLSIPDVLEIALEAIEQWRREHDQSCYISRH